MVELTNVCFLVVTGIALVTRVIIPTVKGPMSRLQPELAAWLQEQALEKHAGLFVDSGIWRLVDVVEMGPLRGLPLVEQERTTAAVFDLKQRLILNHFLKKHGTENGLPRLETLGIRTLKEAVYMVDAFPLEFNDDKDDQLNTLLHSLPRDKKELELLSEEIWIEIAKMYNLPSVRGWNLYSVLCGVGGVVSCWALWWVMTRRSAPKPGLLHLFTGKYLHPQRCTTTFHWDDPSLVGITVAFTVQFYQRNGRPYPISDADGVLVEITQGIHKVGVVTELGGTGEAEINTARCKFSARQAGQYKISILLANQHIRGSPFVKNFLPGPPDPSKTVMVQHSSTVVCTASQPHHILIEPRDQYHNVCSFSPGQADTDNYSISIVELEGGWTVDAGSIIVYDHTSRRISIQVTLQRPGCYRAHLTYCDTTLTNGNFDIIVLTSEDALRVQKTVMRRAHEGYEARLLTQNGSLLSKPKKVYCYVTPKQLIIKEFLLRLIPKRVCTFRLCPSTKFHFTGTNNQSGLPTMSIDDGCQPLVSLAGKDRNVIAATFTQFMLKNIGGSETFKDKQDHFYHEVRKFHSKRMHERIQITVSRERLLETSMKATKNFTVADWCKNFEITFQGEEGLDWGGVRREWFEIICAMLFDNGNELFASLHEGRQALVHPDPYRPPHMKLKHYEFAGRVVGKCLYESALGSGYRQTVRARFSRSFLAQLIGLRVHYKHFAQDDPELYSGKIRHLLDYGVDKLDDDLFFVDEILLPSGQIKVIELEPGGAGRLVTNSNKLQYLDALAQYRLSVRVRHEVDAFLAGLNEIIPDNLLCIFDENELELLMCGIEEYSIADFKANHVVNGSSPEFRRVLYWFWTAVSNFTEEEMARLLQFATGCSRLPPGGFAQLSPHFQISAAHTFGVLPTAHTCFNQLCLPDYDSYEQFEKALLLAIKEGSEGFGMV
ncbi:apoptosis-resistant E3 ubiquitin protein ligase 1 isoform X1 [Procambarus clarkii]|uniref:apoptosis-resistant E3 ubiquitin protein ligase 1 isoform X1 n=1 Tax=Procambarus clarkii TaxID=6728 RepID=UPI001E678B5D|nr:apoptosis-resistant E3 ubiquitin protein ligase 1-like isoform X1 [Procambarus clarkii]